MKIKNITLVNSKGKGQTITLEEARELYDSLSEIFGPKEFELKRGPQISPLLDPTLYGGKEIKTYRCECGGTPYNTLSCPKCVSAQEDIQTSPDHVDAAVLSASKVVHLGDNEFPEDIDQENR